MYKIKEYFPRYNLKKTLVFLLIATWIGILHAESNLPDFGSPARGTFNAKTEGFLGQGIMHSLNGTDQLVTDEAVNDYLQQLGNRLQAHAPPTDFPLHIFGVNTPEINAFAFFGGHIAVHTGLMRMVENESQLAAVLSHESAHVAQKHLARLISNHKKMLPITYAEVLGAIALSVLGAPDLGMHLANIAMGNHTQQLINYTREHEKEADRIGMQILINAGFDPYGMPHVFERLKTIAKYEGKLPEYWLTHPVYESRIADTEGRAAQFGARKPPENLHFHLIRARVLVAGVAKPKELLKQLDYELQKQNYRNKTAVEYAHALTLARLGHTADASAALEKLAEELPEEWLFRLSLAEVDKGSLKLGEASEKFQALLEDNVPPRVVIFQYADTLLAQNKAAAAREVLNTYKSRFASEPILHQLMAKTYSKTGPKHMVHQSQAEWHFHRGEYKEAIAQMEYALENVEGKQWLQNKYNYRKEEIQAFMEKQKKLSI